MSSRSVGKTPNSTGLLMCIETRRTIVDKVIFAVIRISSKNGGRGITIAMRIPKTAIGTTSSHGSSLFHPEVDVFFKSGRILPAVGAGWLVFAVCRIAAELETTGAVMSMKLFISSRYNFLLSNLNT
jgi:hypothetical protein